MALLGMGANVQCGGYFPGYYSTRDLIFGAEGSTCASSNGNSELKNDCYQIGSLPLSSPVHLLGYNKELLKQTILKHESIFRDQIHELHRIYQKQRELMDEIKRNELYKHSLRLETSWSSSSLCYSPNLPWLAGQSSVLIAESIQLPSASVQEKSRQICPAPAPTAIEGSLKDSKLSESKFRKVGKKILDLQLPADEYIDSEEGESLENERVTQVPQLSAYTSNRISQVVSNSDEKPYGANSNGFADLNVPFKLEEETGVMPDDLRTPIHHRNNPFHDQSRRTKLGSHNLPSDVIHNLNRRQDLEVCSDDPLSNQVKKHGRLSSSNSAEQNGGVLDSLDKFNDTEKKLILVESLNKKLEQANNLPCVRSLHQITLRPWNEKKISSGESSAETQGHTSSGLLGPSSASRTCAPNQLVSEADMTSSGISLAGLWKTPVSDFGQSPVAGQSLPCFSTSASLDQSSNSLVGMSGFAGDELYQCKSIKSGPNLDSQNYLLSSSFCSRSKLLDLPSISTNELNSCDNCGSSASHELRKYVKGSEDVGTAKNINLNIMPAGNSDTTAFQSNQITGEEDKFLDSRLPWLEEKPATKGKFNEESKISTQTESVLLKPYKSGGIHCSLKLKKIEESDLSRDKTLAFHINGKPHTSSDLHSFHVTYNVCQNQSKNLWIEEIEKDCISDVNSPCNHVPDIGEQIRAGEHFMENEQKKHEHLAGIIDLNLCMNEDEDMPMDIDFQAPASPENKECSPPRGESDENQPEMPCQLAGQEDPEPQEEQLRIAAEALVSISGVVAHNGLQMTSCPPSESFVSSPLLWFAGIVSSSTIVDHPVNKVKVDFSGKANDLEEFLPADFDYFEFMTLKLTETNVLDCCYKSSGQNEQEGGSTSPTQQRKCRTNRGRRGKDFQSEILPSLASLSRYEVTEDLQTIGGLVEAAGTHPATGYLRSAGRNVLARGRRRSCTSASNITDLLLNLKQLNSNTEMDIEKRGLISWGKICRKRRGQRFPTSNPRFISSQVYN